MRSKMTTPAAAPEGENLPAGYDDKKSRFYVPPELRPYYRGHTPREVAAAFDARLTWDMPGASTRAVAYARHVLRESGELERLDRKYGRFGLHSFGIRNPEPGQADAYNAFIHAVRGMTEEDEAWWLHYAVSLSSARAAYDKAAAWEAARPLREARATCEVCGTVNAPNVHVRGHVQCCGPCSVHLPIERANDTVNGRPRREVVAEWVAANER